MLTKLQTKLTPVWTAVVKQRIAVLIVIAIGVLVALFAPVAPPVRDVAANDVTIGTIAIPGFEPPCTPASVPAFARSGDVINQAAIDSPALAPALNASNVSSVARAPGLMAIRYAGLQGEAVKAEAAAIAGAVVKLCNSRTTVLLTSLTKNLSTVQDARLNDIAAVDANLVPASRGTSQAATLTKRLDALDAQRIDAQQKLAVQQKVAKSAEQQRDALRQLADNEISAHDSLATALRAQRDKDAAALAAAKAQYQDNKYPGLDALVRRVSKDESAIAERSAQLMKSEPQTLSPEFRAAQAAADQARAAADGQIAQIATIDAQLKPLSAEIAKLDAVTVTAATNTLKRDALLKAYNAAAAQRYAAEQQEAQIVAEPSLLPNRVGGPLSLAPQPEPVVETVGTKLALAVRAAVLLAFVVLAAIVALVLNALDRRLLTVDAITKLYGKPVISIVGPKSHA
jgi:hypothetical protein